MADTYLVRIDLDLVRKNFERTEKKPWTVQQVKARLKEDGLIEREDGWIAEEIQVDLLDPTEYEIISEL